LTPSYSIHSLELSHLSFIIEIIYHIVRQIALPYCPDHFSPLSWQKTQSISHMINWLSW